MAYLMVIDDDATLRLLICDFLAGLGHRVVGASNGAEGLRRIREDRPDALVLDLQMPSMDGWSVLRLCRETPGLEDLPVVVMSALMDAWLTVADLSVAHCLRKPFDLDELATALESMAKTAIAAIRPCTYCGAERSARRLRVFTLGLPDGSWLLCPPCWRFMTIGFEAHRPGEDLERRLRAPVPVNATELRGWIRTGLKQTGRTANRRQP